MLAESLWSFVDTQLRVYNQLLFVLQVVVYKWQEVTQAVGSVCHRLSLLTQI